MIKMKIRKTFIKTVKAIYNIYFDFFKFYFKHCWKWFLVLTILVIVDLFLFKNYIFVGIWLIFPFFIWLYENVQIS